jgi:hypothetical protein
MNDQVAPLLDRRPPLEAVQVDTPADGVLRFPEVWRDQITIDVIHDGNVLPPEYLIDARGRRIPERTWYHAYVHERDWGASIVAERIVERLGLGSYLRVNTARALLDFGRFPGSTAPGAPHLRRFAINTPFSLVLDFAQKRRLLEEHYDAVSDGMDEAIRGRMLKIAVHTYDRYNASGTERPQVSLVTRALGYQMDSEMPMGVFDPLYPDVLAEFTLDRVLRDRISLTLEKSGIPVAHNYPYLLPEGSPEVRHQVWCFFDWLHQAFEAAFPDTAHDEAYEWVWILLKDTNLRHPGAMALRSYLHMYRRPPRGEEAEYAAAAAAYHHIEAFLHADDGALIHDYRVQPMRPQAFGIEVRKDLVWDFDEAGHPMQPAPERALEVADRIADALLVYLNEDKPGMNRRDGTFERTGPWYAGR